jgi:hypothetical protein
MPEPGAAQEEALDRTPLVGRVGQQQRRHRRKAEQGGRDDQAGQVLGDDQQLAPQRREEVIVEAALQHLAPDQVAEDRHAPQEDDDPQQKRLVDHGVDRGRLGRVVRVEHPRGHGVDGDRHHQQDRRWRKRQQVEPEGPPAEKALAQLQPQDRRHLPPPEAPGAVTGLGRARRPRRGRRSRHIAHAFSPFPPIRY